MPSRDVPAVHQGTAGALLTTAQYLSGALTLTVLTLLLGPSRSYPGFTRAFVLLAAAAGAGALLGNMASRFAPAYRSHRLGCNADPGHPSP